VRRSRNAEGNQAGFTQTCPWESRHQRYVREGLEMKHRIVHTLQKYVLNPPIKLALAVGLPLPGYALLETKGRKTGKPRRTPVGDGRIGNQFWLVAEHGMKAGYVRNIQYDPRVRLKLREGFRTRWHTGTAQLLSDDDPRERQRWLANQLPSSAGNSRAVRLFGTQLLPIRIDLDDWCERNSGGS
jgi:deazaflavin-dependent oxidoreductase (nitroreductase family)